MISYGKIKWGYLNPWYNIVKEFWIGVNCMDMLLKQMPLGIVILMGNSLKLHALQMGMSMPIA